MLNRFTLNVIFKEKVILTAVIFVSLLFLLSTLVFYPVRSGIRREDDHYENRYIRGYVLYISFEKFFISPCSDKLFFPLSFT